MSVARRRVGDCRRILLDAYGIEIGGGLGPFKGNTWRFGLMGSGSTRRNVVLCLAALASSLGARKSPADALAAAESVWEEEAAPSTTPTQ